MDLRSLNYFVHAAKTLNFTQAAKECYISQTAVSLAIAKLEDELGFLLFERNNRVVGLTEAGKEFYNWASQILQSYDNAVKRCMNIASGYSGDIAIAFASFFDGLFFMPQLKDFKRRYPNVQIRIHTVSPNYMQQALKSGEIDAAVCWPYDFLADDDLTVYDLCNMNLILAVNSQHPFASMERIPAGAHEARNLLYAVCQQPAANAEEPAKRADPRWAFRAEYLRMLPYGGGIHAAGVE